MLIAADDLDECRFVDEDGNLLHPVATPFILMPDPKARDAAGPCQLWIVTKGGQAYLPSEVEIENWEEAEGACDAANSRVGRTRRRAGVFVVHAGHPPSSDLAHGQEQDLPGFLAPIPRLCAGPRPRTTRRASPIAALPVLPPG